MNWEGQPPEKRTKNLAIPTLFVSSHLRQSMPTLMKFGPRKCFETTVPVMKVHMPFPTCGPLEWSLNPAVFEILGSKRIGVTSLTFQGHVTSSFT